MYTWKWSTGEPYYKSAKLEKKVAKNEEQVYDSQTNAINQSLADESLFNQDSVTNTLFSRNQSGSGTKREDLDTKIADREMIAQRGFNPFLQTSYVDDIVTCDMFLKPINTTFEKSKEASKETSKETSKEES
jgi:hypothetical protein